MPGIIGAGSQYYPSGSETLANLVSGAFSLTFTTANVNNPFEIVNQYKQGSAVLPAAYTAGLVSGQSHFGGVIHKGSYALPVFNNGTFGTDPTLEKIVAPGTFFRFGLVQGVSGTAFNNTYSSAAGLWNYFGTQGDLRMMYPLMPFSTATTASGGASGIGSATFRGPVPMAFMSPTLGLFVGIDASTNVYGVAYQLGSGVAASGVSSAAAGLKTQIQAAGGATLGAPSVSRVDDTHACVTFSFSSGAVFKNVFALITLASGVLPAAPTLSLSVSGDDTAAVTGVNNRITSIASTLTAVQPTLTPDNGTLNQWLLGPQSYAVGASGRFRAYYVAVNTVTPSISVAATLDYDPANSRPSGCNSYPNIPYSHQASGLLAFGNMQDAASLVNLVSLTYSASAITSGWALLLPIQGSTYNAGSANSTPTRQVGIYAQDPANGVYSAYSHTANINGATNNIGYAYRIHINPTTGGLYEFEELGTPSFDVTGAPIAAGSALYPAFTIATGDGEFFSIIDINDVTTAFDTRVRYLEGPQYKTDTRTNTVFSGVFSNLYCTSYPIPVPVTSYPIGQGSALGIAFEPRTRRFAYAFYPPNSTTFSLWFGQWPRR